MPRKLAASLSWRVATRRKCFSLEKNRSMRLRSRAKISAGGVTFSGQTLIFLPVAVGIH